MCISSSVFSLLVLGRGGGGDGEEGEGRRGRRGRGGGEEGEGRSGDIKLAESDILKTYAINLNPSLY